MKKEVIISPSIVWWTIGIVLAVGFVYVIRDVVVLFFIALVLSAAIEPAIKRIVAKNISRGVAVGSVYIVLLVLLVTFLAYLIPVAAREVSDFARTLPEHIEDLTGSTLLFDDISHAVTDSLERSGESQKAGGLAGVTQGIFSTTVDVFRGIVSFLAVFTIAFYLSVTDDGVGRFLRSVTPGRYEKYVVSRARIIYHKIGHWMLGQLLLMVIVFVLYFIVLTLLGVPNALALALLGGILEIIPYIGPVVAAIPAILFGFFVSPPIAILVAASYILIQQLENHIIVPQVMKRAVGLNPIVVILALLIGAKVAGVLGMILAVPVATALHVFITDVMEKRGSGKISTA